MDLVGFSLGGLVAREYLSEHWYQSPSQHKIRKLITIATPHQGAKILSLRDWLREHGLEGSFMETAFTAVVNVLINLVRTPNGQPLDTHSLAATQLTPRSDYITWLESIAVTPRDVDLLYGDINAQIHTQLFPFDISKQSSFGDLLISVESATGIPFKGKQTHRFADDRVFDILLKLTEDGDGFRFIADIPQLEEFLLRHTELPKQPEVIDRVFQILQSD